MHSASHTMYVHLSNLLISCSVNQMYFCFAGPNGGPGPSSEQSSGGTDRRGRQKITWQPPTASQKESDAQVHIFTMSLFKAALLFQWLFQWGMLLLEVDSPKPAADAHLIVSSRFAWDLNLYPIHSEAMFQA